MYLFHYQSKFFFIFLHFLSKVSVSRFLFPKVLLKKDSNINFKQGITLQEVTLKRIYGKTLRNLLAEKCV